MKRMKLQEVCEVYSGYALKEFHDSDEGYPVIKIGNICSDGTLDLEKCQFTNDSVNDKYYSKKGDIYVALSGATTGKIGIINTDDKYIINQRVGIVRKMDKEIPDQYIKYFLMNKTEKILEDASGCAQPNISPKQIGQYEFSKIDYFEMNQISDILDKVSSVIAQRKLELQKLDDLIKARFVEMFVGKNYPLVALDDLSLGKGEYGTQSASIEYDPSRPRYVRITDIQDDGTLNDDVVSSANIEDDEQYKLSYGDFMFARMGATVGKTYAYKSGNQIFAGYLIRYRLNLKRIIPGYLYAYTRLEEYKNWVLLNQSGAAQPGINAKKYGSLLIPVAPLEEQRAFEDFVQQVDKSKFRKLCYIKF